MTALRRHVTVVFSDLCDSTRLGHRSDPEVLAEVLRQVKLAALRVVARHAGTVNQFYGDGVMSIFGLPVPREDDPRRAVEYTLELHRAVQELSLDLGVSESFDLELHSGIHAGLVVIREGDAVRGRYELIGDATNTAAGLCANARVDEILVSEPTLRGVLPFFDADEIQPLLLKGKPEPLRAFRVTGRSGVITRFEARLRRGLAPFIGREAVLERLTQRLREARAGGFRRAALVGDPGIGKTRVLEEFLRGADARACAVYQGYCESYGSVAPLQPFQRVLEQVFELGHEAADESASARVEAQLEGLGLARHTTAILQILGLRPAAEGGEAAASAALLELLTALAQREPLVLVIDDWQWADDASRQAVGAIARNAQEAPVLLLIAARELHPSDADAEDGELLRLEPFSPDESAEAVEALLPTPAEPDTAAQLHERSGGNPLYLEELCQSLCVGAPGADVELPVTLQGLIEARVHRLPPDQAELVRVAAVIGNVIPTWLLEEIGSGADGDSRLRELAGNDLVYAGETEGMLRFKHGITRDVIYELVGLAERRALHLRIAAALEAAEGRGEAFEALAYHCAGGADYERAARYAELAGDRASAGAATDRARQQYAAALAALDRLEPTQELRRRWLDIVRRLAFASLWSPAPEQLDTLARAAQYAEELGDLDALGHARYWLGFINYCLGRQAESIREYERGQRVAEEAGNPKLVAQLRANIGEALASAGEYRRALALLDDAIERKGRLHSGTGRVPTGSAYAMSCKACALGERGDFTQAHRLIDHAVQALAGSGSPVEGSIRSFHAIILLCQGRWKECIETTEFVLRTGERVNGPYLCSRGRSEAAYARFMLTGERDALDALKQTTDWLEAHQMRLYVSLNHGCLAEGYAHLGETELAWHHGQLALERANEQDRFGEGMACRALATLVSRADSPDEAAADRYLERAMQSARARGSEREIALTQLARAELYARFGRVAAARQLVDEAQQAFRRMGMAWHEGEAERIGQGL